MCSTSPSAEGPDFVENMRRYAQPKLDLSYSSKWSHTKGKEKKTRIFVHNKRKRSKGDD